MKTSDQGKNLIKKWESCKLQAYLAPEQVKLAKEKGIYEYTIGWGATYIPSGIELNINGKKTKYNQNIKISKEMVLDQASADKLFELMLPMYEAPVNKLVTVPLAQNQYDALVSFVYNVGEGNFKASTLLKRLNSRDYAGACANLARWDNIGKEESTGLENRRVEEITLFASALNNIIQSN